MWLCVLSRESGEREKAAVLKHLVPEVKQNLGEVKISLGQHRETRGVSKHCHADPPYFFLLGKWSRLAIPGLHPCRCLAVIEMGTLESQE